MRFNKFLMMGAAVAVMGIGANKAYAVDDALTMTATIVTPIDIDCTGGLLDFGSIDAGTTGGTVTVDLADGRTIGGGDGTLVGGTGAGTGECVLTGDNLLYTITIPADSVDDPGLGAPMAVDNFLIHNGVDAASASPYSGTLTGGTDTLLIGAELTVAGGQLPGVYTGSVDVTAVYQ